LLNRKEKTMFSSYGEISGFSPVSGEELTTVNGGSFTLAIAILLGLAATAISGCAQPTNSDELNKNAQFPKGY
jgi:hypothetical protein